jgi:hypothetical protein
MRRKKLRNKQIDGASGEESGSGDSSRSRRVGVRGGAGGGVNIVAGMEVVDRGGVAPCGKLKSALELLSGNGESGKFEFISSARLVRGCAGIKSHSHWFSPTPEFVVSNRIKCRSSQHFCSPTRYAVQANKFNC